MTPSRTAGRDGNFRFDRVIKGVGRITNSSETNSVAEFRRREALLLKLRDQSRLELLRAFKAGRISMAELMDADLRDDLARSETGIVNQRRFLEAARAIVKQKVRNARTRKDYEQGLNSLERRSVVVESTRVADLEHLPWAEVEADWPHSAADWSRVRRTVSHVLTLLLGKYHPFRLAVMPLIPRRGYVPREPSLTPAEFWAAVSAMPEPMRCIPVAFVVTGLREAELWQALPEHLRPRAHALWLPPRGRARSLKTEDSAKLLELDPRSYAYVAQAVQAVRVFTPNRILGWWHRACKAVGAPHTTLHDLRHCFGQWSLDAQVSDADVQQMLRHKTPFMTRIYRMRQQRRSAGKAVAKIVFGAQAKRGKRKRA